MSSNVVSKIVPICTELFAQMWYMNIQLIGFNQCTQIMATLGIQNQWIIHQ